MSMTHSISIVIPTWNAANFVERVLGALVCQEDVSIEILVVDNGVVNQDTEKVTAHFAEKWPFIRYLAFKEQLGYAGAVNAGVRASTHNLVMVMNNDNIPFRDCAKKLLDSFLQKKWNGKEIAIVSAIANRPGIALAAQKGSLNFCGRIIYSENFYKEAQFPIFHPDGSAFLFDKEKLGIPYNEEYFIYHEDVALGWRARLMGYEVLANLEAKVESFDGGSTKRIPYRTAYYSERNRWLNNWGFCSLTTILKIFPLWCVDVSLTILLGSNRRAKIHAHLWTLSHLSWVWNYRKQLQSLRKSPDSEVLSLISSNYINGSGIGALIVNIFTRIYCAFVGLPFSRYSAKL